LRIAANFASNEIAASAFIWGGYMTAGAALIDEVQRQPHNRNLLLYPILFNYRHGLESVMKWTVERRGPGESYSDGIIRSGVSSSTHCPSTVCRRK
jgi:hypothetical protein